MRSAPTLFLQPHYDDVALSCGGTAALCAQAGHEPLIVTVFASELVHGMVGPFAEFKHSRWQLDDPDEVLATRRREDAQAAEELGCRLRWLGLPDAIYRGDRYTSDAALYGPVHAEERELPAHLAEELVHLPEWRDGMQVAVPLAVGDHVDHQIAYLAGRELAARGIAVWAYEDLPYAIHTPTALEARLRALEGQLQGPVAVDIEAVLPRKLASIASYGSQLPVIFRFTPDFGAAIRDHARAAGGGPATERFWRVRPSR